MNKVMVVVFDGEKRAYEGLSALNDLHREGSVTRYADAVIAKDASGKVSVRRSPESDPEGTLLGFLLGSLAGVLAGPVGFAVGAGTGTLIGAAFDLSAAGIGADFIDEVSEFLVPGKAALITEIEEEWQTPLDTRMEALGGQVFRRNRTQVEDAYYEKQITAFEAELDALDAEMEQASAERKARLTAKVEETQRKLRAKRDELKTHIEAVKREGDAKMESLRQQITTANQEQKKRLESRLAQVRADYERRSAKLQQAWELTKAALAP
jgi:uncharacterized membrane protein